MVVAVDLTGTVDVTKAGLLLETDSVDRVAFFATRALRVVLTAVDALAGTRIAEASAVAVVTRLASNLLAPEAGWIADLSAAIAAASISISPKYFGLLADPRGITELGREAVLVLDTAIVWLADVPLAILLGSAFTIRGAALGE